MRPSTAQWRRSLATGAALTLFGGFVLVFSASPASAQAQRPDTPGAPASDVSNIPKPITDTFDRANLSNRPNDADLGRKTAENDTTCLLPPLILTNSPTIAADQLRIAAKARKEYHQACAALKDKNLVEAERHLRKAVKEDLKYSAAWVTLGQALATQGRNEEARSACFQGTIADPRYVSAFLCLADIAARAHAWHEVLKLSERAIELDPSANAVAYEYDAVANLNLHNLADAEKSGKFHRPGNELRRPNRTAGTGTSAYTDSANSRSSRLIRLKQSREPSPAKFRNSVADIFPLQAGSTSGKSRSAEKDKL
jgi:hypothetical protein